jgi:hypothetical protein
MIDLNRINSGLKLIKKVISSNKSNKTPWSRKSQKEQIAKQVNSHNQKSRFAKK